MIQIEPQSISEKADLNQPHPLYASLLQQHQSLQSKYDAHVRIQELQNNQISARDEAHHSLVESLKQQLQAANGMNEVLLDRIKMLKDCFQSHTLEMVNFKSEIAEHLANDREVQRLKVENARLKKKVSVGIQYAELHQLIQSR